MTAPWNRGCCALAELRDEDGHSWFAYCVGDMKEDPHKEHVAPHPFKRGYIFWANGGPVDWADPGRTDHRETLSPSDARSLPPGPAPLPRLYSDGAGPRLYLDRRRG